MLNQLGGKEYTDAVFFASAKWLLSPCGASSSLLVEVKPPLLKLSRKNTLCGLYRTQVPRSLDRGGRGEEKRSQGGNTKVKRIKRGKENIRGSIGVVCMHVEPFLRLRADLRHFPLSYQG